MLALYLVFFLYFLGVCVFLGLFCILVTLGLQLPLLSFGSEGLVSEVFLYIFGRYWSPRVKTYVAK